MTKWTADALSAPHTQRELDTPSDQEMRISWLEHDLAFERDLCDRLALLLRNVGFGNGPAMEAYRKARGL